MRPPRAAPAPAGSAQRTRPARRFPRKTSLRTQATPRTFVAGRARAQSMRPARQFPRKASLRTQATPRTLAAGRTRTRRECPKHAPRAAVSSENELAPASDSADTRGGSYPHPPGVPEARAPRGGFHGKRACVRKRPRGHPQRAVPAGFTKYLQILVLTFPDHCSIL